MVDTIRKFNWRIVRVNNWLFIDVQREEPIIHGDKTINHSFVAWFHWRARVFWWPLIVCSSHGSTSLQCGKAICTNAFRSIARLFKHFNWFDSIWTFDIAWFRTFENLYYVLLVDFRLGFNRNKFISLKSYQSIFEAFERQYEPCEQWMNVSKIYKFETSWLKNMFMIYECVLSLFNQLTDLTNVPAIWYSWKSKILSKIYCHLF